MASQRQATKQFWLGLDSDDRIPITTDLEMLTSVTLDSLASDYRETAKANFRGIARGGEPMDCLFLTCFADYAGINLLLGSARRRRR